MEHPEAARVPRLRGARLDVLLAIALTLLAGGLRFVRLDEPHDIVPLDETYYAVNAFGYAQHGVDMQCSGGAAPEHYLIGGLPCPSGKGLDPAFAVHPPVGKWLIAGGIKVVGYSSFGYRSAAALFGTLSVLVLFLLARRLWRNTWLAATAALLLALDGLHFVQSRIAMLDIFLAFFVLLSVWLLVEDRERTPPGYRGIRGWRIASGVALGLALGTKWSAAFVIPMIFVVGLVWELDRAARGRRAAAAPAYAGVPTTLDPLGPGVPGLEAEGSQPELQSGVLETVEVSPGVFEPPETPDEPGTALSVPEHAGLEESLGGTAPAIPAAAYARPQVRSGTNAFAVLGGACSLVLLPVVVYVLTYASWFAAKPDMNATADVREGPRYTAPRCDDPSFTGYLSPVNSKVWNLDVWPGTWRSWVCYQREIFDYHKNLKNFDDKGKPIHPYLTRAWSWPWIGRPTAHEFDSKETAIKGNPLQAEIIGLPNPAGWFAGFFIALPLCAWWAVTRRDQVAALLLLLFAPLYVPWLVTSRPLFMFYMTPAVAFLILPLCHVIHRAMQEWNVHLQRILIAAMLVLPFTPLFIQWFSVPGFTMQLGTNASPGPVQPWVPLVKMLAVGGTAGLVWLAVAVLYQGRRPVRLLASYAGVVLAFFVYFYPVLAAVHIPDTGAGMSGVRQRVWQAYGWRPHMWLTADCRAPGIKIACWI